MLKGALRMFWSGQPRIVEAYHNKTITCVAIDEANKVIVTGGDDATVRVWDGSTGKCVHAYRGHRRPIVAVAVVRRRAPIAAKEPVLASAPPAPSTSDSEAVLSTDQSGYTAVWELKSGRKILDIRCPSKFYVCGQSWTPRAHNRPPGPGSGRPSRNVTGLCCIPMAVAHPRSHA
jgi:WD40 repeat protein